MTIKGFNKCTIVLVVVGLLSKCQARANRGGSDEGGFIDHLTDNRSVHSAPQRGFISVEKTKFVSHSNGLSENRTGFHPPPTQQSSLQTSTQLRHSTGKDPTDLLSSLTATNDLVARNSDEALQLCDAQNSAHVDLAQIRGPSLGSTNQLIGGKGREERSQQLPSFPIACQVSSGGEIIRNNKLPSNKPRNNPQASNILPSTTASRMPSHYNSNSDTSEDGLPIRRGFCGGRKVGRHVKTVGSRGVLEGDSRRREDLLPKDRYSSTIRAVRREADDGGIHPDDLVIYYGSGSRSAISSTVSCYKMSRGRNDRENKPLLGATSGDSTSPSFSAYDQKYPRFDPMRWNNPSAYDPEIDASRDVPCRSIELDAARADRAESRRRR
ncbi:hypothetical protein K458DRAFT_471998 [Lentithecium fluviatile CBS 122367]|uniref:Uncharacterized protein n=1 Tax=Lentithecium fluviatile CBS 122367 TaxID=1168545 RepID=A0A6G1IBK7_9PLEO|nr:hypothetical protein K458DRAFT_471998 [Lentithecium fluviatile CBS 122367]